MSCRDSPFRSNEYAKLAGLISIALKNRTRQRLMESVMVTLGEDHEHNRLMLVGERIP